MVLAAKGGKSVRACLVAKELPTYVDTKILC